MGSLKLQSHINGVEEERYNNGHTSNRGDLACMVSAEIGAVLAVMRRNVRWGDRYVSGGEQIEHSLIQSLKSLRKQIFSWQQNWNAINPVVYLEPFLEVIKSDETGAPITGVALSSVYKILSLDIIDVDTVNVEDAMSLVVDAVTSCRFEVTDPASEEVVLMKILQVLLACMKSKAAIMLSNQHVCTIVNTCFRVVHQAGAKGELLQRIARHTMHELIRCIFSHLPNIATREHSVGNGTSCAGEQKFAETPKDLNSGSKQIEKVSNGADCIGQSPPVDIASNPTGSIIIVNSDMSVNDETSPTDLLLMTKPYGVPCMVEILHFLCSLLNIIEHIGGPSRSNSIAYDEDVPLFALGLINSAIELGGPSISQHPKLLMLIQDELFHNLLQFGLSTSPLILSMVCSIVLNLYHHLRAELKLQFEAFFSCVISRLVQSRFGASYQQQEVAMEALVDFCRQKTFMVEMYANLDCDITCSNVFEDLANLLSKSAFPVNSPLSAINILAMDGLVSLIQGMAERLGSGTSISDQAVVNLEEYTPFWDAKCENHTDPDHWVSFVRQRKTIKRKLMTGVDHFNRDTKKGLEFLQGTHLLPDKLDPKSVACFFRYTNGLDKDLVGDYLGNHDQFCIDVLQEFAGTFDFEDMSLDTALRVFLETFRLPGESQKIQRVLEAFSERYYEQSPLILANKDAALLLSYSIILLNTDHHNIQVKKKMTEEDFIRNNRHINGGSDLPREFLSELYHSVCKNEIRTIPEEGVGFPVMTPTRWVDLMCKSKNTCPFIGSDSRAFIDRDMFSIISGPTIAAISVVYDYADHEDVFQTCVDGFLSVAKIAAFHHLDDILDDLVLSLCKFTTLLSTSNFEDSVLALGEDAKARMATETLFSIANLYGSYIRSGWRDILGCILRLHRAGLLPSSTASDENELSPGHNKPLLSSQKPSVVASQKSSGLMGRFSQLLYLDTEEPSAQPADEVVQHTLHTIQNCHIDNIFTESSFLHADSLLQLAQALILVAGKPQKGKTSPLDEDSAVFCLELLIMITLNNRDRILLLWQSVYEHISSIVQSTVMPCALVEKAVFGLLKICQRLLPYKESLADELLRSLQLVLKLDARVADAYCENITQEVMYLVKASATHIRSQMGWQTITSLLSITARHPDASESGFEALTFVMSDGVHLSPANYILCVDAARQFAESRVGPLDRSLCSLDLMAGSVSCLTRWSGENKENSTLKVSDDIQEMWLRLVKGLKKICVDQREEIRNHGVFLLQRCLVSVDGITLSDATLLQCFELVIFSMLDDLLEIAQDHSPKQYRNMEGTLVLAMKLMSKVFLQLLQNLLRLTTFSELWLEVLSRMEKYIKAKIRGKRSEKLRELIPELLKNTLLVLRTSGVLVQNTSGGGNNLWESTWLHVKDIAPALKSDVFPDQIPEQSVIGGTPVSNAEGIAT
ncbi:hypothetical protein ACHQM5_010574 [Ranunculus cassubicifolius]